MRSATATTHHSSRSIPFVRSSRTRSTVYLVKQINLEITRTPQINLNWETYSIWWNLLIYLLYIHQLLVPYLVRRRSIISTIFVFTYSTPSCYSSSLANKQTTTVIVSLSAEVKVFIIYCLLLLNSCVSPFEINPVPCHPAQLPLHLSSRIAAQGRQPHQRPIWLSLKFWCPTDNTEYGYVIHRRLFLPPPDNHKFDISAQSTGRPLPHPPPIHRRDHHPHRGCLCRSTENIIGHKVLGVKILINFTQDRPSCAPRSSLNMFESSIRSPVHSHSAACLTSLSIHQHKSFSCCATA